MDDDLGVPGALAVVHEAVTSGNTSLDEGDREAAAATARIVVAMTEVLGINPLNPRWAGLQGGQQEDVMAALDALVRDRVAARAIARETRDFATADAIRDDLAAAGVVVEDTPAGARWTLAKPPTSQAPAESSASARQNTATQGRRA
jgi:cysteinyl-tRNA synthetase